MLVVGSCLAQELLTGTYNLQFHEELTKLSFNYHRIPTLIRLLVSDLIEQWNIEGEYLRIVLYFELLAHLSRRLIGELIVYTGIWRPSVRQHFQTTSPLKPVGGFFPYSSYSIYR